MEYLDRRIKAVIRKAHLEMIGVILLLSMLSTFADADEKETNELRADFSAAFMCGDTLPASVVEKKSLGFLDEAGFQTINVNHIRPFELLKVEVTAMDAGGHLLNLDSIPRPRGRYHISFFSRPPTRRSVELENKITAFITAELGCDLVKIKRDVNDLNAAQQYESAVANFKSMLGEAKSP